MSSKRRIQTFLEDLRSILMEDMICMIPFVFFDWMWHIYNQTLCTSSLLTSCCTISQCFCWIPFIFAWTQPLPLLLHLLKNKKVRRHKNFHTLSLCLWSGLTRIVRVHVKFSVHSVQPQMVILFKLNRSKDKLTFIVLYIDKIY